MGSNVKRLGHGRVDGRSRMNVNPFLGNNVLMYIIDEAAFFKKNSRRIRKVGAQRHKHQGDRETKKTI
jgi:hypothetical protein